MTKSWDLDCLWFYLTLFRMGFFGAAHRWGGRGQKGPPSSLKSATHILQWGKLAQLYLTWKRSKKCMNHVTHPMSPANISNFSPEISKFCYIKKYMYRLHLSMTSTTKFYHVIESILWMWSCEQSLVALNISMREVIIISLL